MYKYSDALPPTTFFSGSTLASLRTDYAQDRRAFNLTWIVEKVKRTGASFYISYTNTETETTGDVYCAGLNDPVSGACFTAGQALGYENGKKDGFSWLYGVNLSV